MPETITPGTVVTIRTRDGTATVEDGDYESVLRTLTVDPGDAIDSVPVTASVDRYYDPGESFWLDVTSSETGFSPVEIELCIEEDYPKIQVHRMATATEGEVLQFRVSTDKAHANKVIPFEYQFEIRTRATPSYDYRHFTQNDYDPIDVNDLANPGDIWNYRDAYIPAKAESTVIGIETKDDDVYESLEALIVTIRVPAEGAQVGPDADANVLLDLDSFDDDERCPWGICVQTACCICGLIRDNEPKPNINVSLRPVQGAERAEAQERLASTTNRDDWIRMEVVLSEIPTINYSLTVGTDPQLGGTAEAATDYHEAETRVFFPRSLGVRRQIVEFRSKDDDTREADEYFYVRVRKDNFYPNHDPDDTLRITDDRERGYIIDDDVTISVADARATEGGELHFEVARTKPTAYVPEFIVWAETHDSSATRTTDFEKAARVLTFTSETMTTTFSVQTLDDAEPEPDETMGVFLVVLGGEGFRQVTLADGTAVGTIVDDDGPPGNDGPVVAQHRLGVVDAASVFEGSSVDFKVDLRPPSLAEGETVVARFHTEDGTATAQEGDYRATTGAVTFTADSEVVDGAFRESVPVATLEDDLVEGPETVYLGIETADPNVEITKARGHGVIEDRQVVEVGVADADAITEGEDALFAISLSQASPEAVTVNYATRDETAVAGEDYLAAAGTATFARGETRKTVRVSALVDGAEEEAETFALDIATPPAALPSTSLVVTDSSARGTILDETGPGDAPNLLNSLTIEGDEVPESAGKIAFELTWEPQREETVLGYYAYTVRPAGTVDPSGTAGADSDERLFDGNFEAKRDTLTLAAGEGRRTLAFTFEDDDIALEDAEPIRLEVYLEGGAPAYGSGAIVDDDEPELKARCAPGGEPTTPAVVEVRLGTPSIRPVRLDWTVADGTAEADLDLQAAATGRLVLQPRVQEQSLGFDVVDDALVEGDEDFGVELSKADGQDHWTAFDSETVRCLIEDDDAYPDVSIRGPAEPVPENAQDGVLPFTVELSSGYPSEVVVGVRSRDVTALAGEDYEHMAVALTFAPGQTALTVNVPIVDDEVVEAAHESMVAMLSNPVNARIGVGEAEGVIEDDDLSTISINDVEGPEDAGTFVFEVVMNNPNVEPVTVEFATAGRTATPGADYTESTGTLTFEPGETGRRLPVPVLDDVEDEEDETFVVMLSDPVADRVEVGKREGIGTIIDNDEPPTVVGELPRVVLCVGGAAAEVALGGYFDGTDVTYRILDGDPTVAGVAVDDGVLTAAPVNTGSSRVTVEAGNETGTVTAVLEVEVVVDEAEREAVANALAAAGRHTLSEVMDAIGARQDVMNRGTDRGRTTAGGRFAGWARTGHRGFDTGTVSHGTTRVAQLAVEVVFDAWKLGLMAMRSESDGVYEFTKTLEVCGTDAAGRGGFFTATDSLHPYAVRTLGDGSVWATLGVGTGEGLVRHRCAEAPDLAGDLDALTWAFGGRHPFRTGDRTTWSVVESLGVWRWESELALWRNDRRRMEVGLARVGIEASRSRNPDCECVLETYGRLWMQTEWGDGETGDGVEFDAGVRYADTPRRFGARAGVWYTPAYADGHRGKGWDVTLDWLPGADGTGWRGTYRYHPDRTSAALEYAIPYRGGTLIPFVLKDRYATGAGVRWKAWTLKHERTPQGNATTLMFGRPSRHTLESRSGLEQAVFRDHDATEATDATDATEDSWLR